MSSYFKELYIFIEGTFYTAVEVVLLHDNMSWINPFQPILLFYERCVCSIHCGKKHRKFLSQITNAADHNKPVTENSGVKFPTFLMDWSAIYIGIFSAIYFGKDKLSFNMRLKKNFFRKGIRNSNELWNSTYLFTCLFFMHDKT